MLVEDGADRRPGPPGPCYARRRPSPARVAITIHQMPPKLVVAHNERKAPSRCTRRSG